MSERNGDRSMYHRKRKAKIARRLKTADLRTQLAASKPAGSKTAASKPAEAKTAKKAVPKKTTTAAK